MFATKPISLESVPGALAKAERYRLLNEPEEAESICQDILEIDPNNHQARISLVLALTDQIPHNGQAFAHAQKEIESMQTAYDRAYYSGIAWERRAKARHVSGLGAHHYVYDWIQTAMLLFEEAERLRPPRNDDAVLRWNACVRFLEKNPALTQPSEEVAEPIKSE